MQIADAPGRNEPGTGTLDIDYYLGRIAATGYDGWVGLEYKPSGKSADSFGWLPRRTTIRHWLRPPDHSDRQREVYR